MPPKINPRKNKKAKAKKTNITQISHLKVVEKDKGEALPAPIAEAQTDTVQSAALENDSPVADELAKHFDEEVSKEVKLDSRANEAAQEDDISAIKETDNNEVKDTAPKSVSAENVATIEEAVHASSNTSVLEEIVEAPLAAVKTVETPEQPLEDAPILQRIPPLAAPVKVIEAPKLAEVTELNAFEDDGADKDPIDELFDNIDHLVKSKGVAKGMGFLKSREYYKS